MVNKEMTIQIFCLTTVNGLDIYVIYVNINFFYYICTKMQV